MKSFKKYGVLILIAIIGFIGIELVINWDLLYPEKYFNHSLDYGHFIIKSDEPISDEIYVVLDDVNFRLAKTLNFGHDYYNIFLCGDIESYGYFANKAGKAIHTQGFNLQPLSHIFINTTFIQEIKDNNKEEYRYSILEGNLAHIIAHEICHQLIADEIGYLKMRNVDNWKLEGFCEYSASIRLKEKDKEYDFTYFSSSFFKRRFKNISKGRAFYVKSLLMTEYLIEFKGFDFNQIVSTNLNETEIINQIKTDKSL